MKPTFIKHDASPLIIKQSIFIINVNRKLMTYLKNCVLPLKLMLMMLFLSAFQQINAQATITGTVTDSSGTPLSGVSVQIKNTTTGTTTNAQGVYTITASPDNVLVFSYVGHNPQEITVGTQTTINASLMGSAASQLTDVVVVGYGTQRKQDVTGSIAQIKGEEISKQASINPVSALQGKVAGVQINNQGAPGSSPQIRIRGLGTVYGDPNPLYVVDGVWFNDISFLNPADIENVSILKDASSEAIYGIRAANGVVLITTKKGKSGRINVNYNGFVGYQTPTNPVKMANANEYAQLVNELSGTEVLNPADYGEGTDWYAQMLRNAFITNHQISVSGGNEKTTFNLSLGFLDQDGIVEQNNYKRYTVKFQNDIKITNNIKIGYTITSAASHSKDVPGGIFHEMFSAYPVLPVYYADGSYGDPGDYPLGDGAKFNPQVTLDYFDQTSRIYRLTGSIYGDVKFLKDFTYHVSLGGEYADGHVVNYNPVYTATLNQRNAISVLTLTDDGTRNWIFENTLSYNKRIGSHAFTILAGQSAQSYKYIKSIGTANNVPYQPKHDYYLDQGTDVVVHDVDINNPSNPAYPLHSTIASYFGRLTYSFADRYLLTATMRADGSSKFTEDQRWGYFPSVGVGWVLTKEKFMENQDIFSNLKLRGSWGKIGNVSVPANLSVQTVTQSPSLTAIFGGEPTQGRSINTIVPPLTYWEKGVGTDIGLEAGFMNNKLTFEADYYIKKTENAIFDIPVLSSIGTGSGRIIGNQADFENKGWEFTVGYRGSISQNLTFSVNANFSINNNEVLRVTTGANPIYAGGAGATGGALTTITVVGQPIGMFYGYQVEGIFQTADEVANSAQPTAQPGDFKYADLSGSDGKPDGAISGLDRVVLGNPNPKYLYGINTTWGYKNFDLMLDFQGVAGVEIYNANLGLRYGNENFTKDFYDNRWHGQGTSNSYPSAKIGGGTNYLPNSFYVSSGSYFRVRNAQLGYTFSTDLTQRWKIQSLRIFANAQNPLNFFSYKGFSPEIGGTPTNAGIDANVYPLYATYNFGVNVNF